MEAQEKKVPCFLHPRQLEVAGHLTRAREETFGVPQQSHGVTIAEELQDRTGVKEDITLHLIMMKGAHQDMVPVEAEHHQVEETELLRVQVVVHLEDELLEEGLLVVVEEIEHLKIEEVETGEHLVVNMVTPLPCMMNK